MRDSSHYIKSLLILALTLVFSIQGPAFAKTACNDMKKKECVANDKCSWVKGYTKKDGTKVKGHCKAGHDKKDK